MKTKAVTKAKPPRRSVKQDRETALYERVYAILDTARITSARSVNTAQVIANWLIGREIIEEEQAGKGRAGYGAALLEGLAVRLRKTFGVGYGVDNLELFRRFYLGYPLFLDGANSDALRRNFNSARLESVVSSPALTLNSPISDAVRRKLARTHAVGIPSDPTWRPGQLSPDLSWTHYRTLLRVDREDARAFYEIEAQRNSWAARELERQINSLLYDRLASSRNKREVMRLATHGHEINHPIDLFKDPIVLEFLNLPSSPALVESELEGELVGNLQNFLLELGKGFAFVGRQHRLTLNGDHFYTDLVFYHTVLKCYILIDLKVGKLVPSDLAQMMMYVNYFDTERRTTGDADTIGLILCTDKNDDMVHYALNAQTKRTIHTRRYQLHLPSKEELEALLRQRIKALGSRPSLSHLTSTAKPAAKRARKTPKTRAATRQVAARVRS